MQSYADMTQSGLDSASAAHAKTLENLNALSLNLYWVWNSKIRKVFETINADSWSKTENPVIALQSRDRLRSLLEQTNFQELVAEAISVENTYLYENKATWFNRNYGIFGKNHLLVAYFSAEFGLAKCLGIYSGGLGVLSADHLKSASDLGIPLVGIGLFYKNGYFSQNLTAENWQGEAYPENEPSNLPIQEVRKPGKNNDLLLVQVPIAGRQVSAKVWKVLVGKTVLYLLDTNVPEINSKEDCEITSTLYGGDDEIRIKQELVLGFGGASLLEELGLNPSIVHMNEGHSAFVVLARILEAMEDGLEFDSAMREIRKQNLFTTHTPVPAGIDCFSKNLIEKYFSFYLEKSGLSMDQLFALGQETPESQVFNMAVLALKNSRCVNAVSKLHGRVAGGNWNGLLQQGFGRECSRNSGSMDYVTNGIHIPTWISGSMASLYDEYIGSDWYSKIDNKGIWNDVRKIPNDVLWSARSNERSKLAEYVRKQTFGRCRFDPNVLTIGFARRFATYKRATLLLHDKARLARLLGETAFPIQIIFSGKAHPRDHEGKKLIQEIVNFSNSPESSGRIVFLENYDLSVARHMVQGVDLWLNNPKRPLEASGTSGMKVIANGGLNLSILDGWWDEAYEPNNGWAISSKQEKTLPESEVDAADAASLYEILETQVVPEFYNRQGENGGFPAKWVERMKNSISSLAFRFNTSRMVKEYAQKYYFRDIQDVARNLNHSEMGVQLLDTALENASED